MNIKITKFILGSCKYLSVFGRTKNRLLLSIMLLSFCTYGVYAAKYDSAIAPRVYSSNPNKFVLSTAVDATTRIGYYRSDFAYLSGIGASADVAAVNTFWDINNKMLATSPGTIAGNQSLCSGGDPLAFTSISPGVVDPTASLTYRWESSVSPFSVWNTISGETNAIYDASSLTATTQYRRIAISTDGTIVTESVPSNVIEVTIAVPPTLTSSVVNTSCGFSNGTISIISTNATSFLWSDGVTARDRTGLLDGNYRLTSSNFAGCRIDNFVVGSSSTLGVDLRETPINCFGESSGSITAIVTSGGTGLYTYDWTGPGSYTSTNQTITSRPAGLYTLLVRDLGNGCFRRLPIPLDQPARLSVQPLQLTNVRCFGINSGAINLSVSGGTLPYTYKWTGPNLFSDSKEDISDLAAGNYNVTITDANGCTAVANATITEATAVLSATAGSQVNLSCFGGNGGSVVITAVGGTAGYTITAGQTGLTTGSNPFTVTGLRAGLNTFTVTDRAGCTSTVNVTITEPTALVAYDVTGRGSYCSGGIGVPVGLSNSTTGVNYQLRLNGVNSGPAVLGTGNAFSFGNRTAQGTYTVIATNTVTNCTLAMNGIAIITIDPSPIAPVTAVTQPTCATAGGTITVTVQSGTDTYSFDNGTTFQAGNSKSGLARGSYNVIIRSAAGCDSSVTIATVNTQLVTPTAPVTAVTQPTCATATGAITVTVQNATDTYSFDNGATFQASNSKSGLARGSYNVIVKNASGCDSSVTAAIVNVQPVTPTAPATAVTQPTCAAATGTITVTVQNATDTYSFDNGATFQTSNSKSVLSRGIYSVIIKSAGGCDSSVTVATVNAQPTTPAVPATAAIQPTCAAATGTITVTVQNATDTYSFDNGTTFQASNSKSGLATGSYNVIIKSAGGCSSLVTAATVNAQLVTPAVPTVVVTAPTCTAAATNVLSTFTLGLVYTSTPIGLSIDSNGLITGGTNRTSYTITATNASLCSATTAIFIFNGGAILPTPAVPTVVVTAPTCSSVATNILSTYNASLNYTSTPTGLTVGAGGVIRGGTTGTPYTITATNTSLCSATTANFTFNGEAILLPAVPTVVVTAPTCSSAATNILSAYNASLTYTSTPTGLTVGAGGAITGGTTGTTYTITVTNTSSCSATTANFTFNGGAILPTPAVPTVVVTAPTCVSAATNILSAYSASLNYTSTPIGLTVGAGGVIANGITGISYTITAVNTSSCSATTLIFTFNGGTILPTPAAPTVVVTPPTCVSAATNILNTYSASLAYTSTPIGLTVGAGGVITNGTTGTSYTITAVNTSLCSATTANFTFNGGAILPTPAVPTVVVTAPTCTAAATNILSTYSSSLTYTSTPAGLTVGAAGLITNGTTGTSYTISATNASLCSAITASFTFNGGAINPLPTAPTAVITEVPTCSTPTGTIAITSPVGDFEYNVDGGAYQTSPRFVGLTSGSHAFTTRSRTDNTCVSLSFSIDIINSTICAKNDAIDAGNGSSGNVNAGNVFNNNGSGIDTLNGVQGLIEDVILSVTSPASSIAGAPVPVIDTATGQINVPAGIPGGIYTIEYSICEKANAGKCSRAVVTITVTDQCVIDVSNAVTPNNDGDNDYFHIGGLDCFSNNSLEIYNRWGVLVFEASKYNNVDNRFIGNANGRSVTKQSDGLPDGTYYYVLKYVDFSGKVSQKAGYLYLSK